MKSLKLIILVLLLGPFNSGYSQSNRAQEHPKDKIIDAIGVKSGDRIGEIGVGSGYLTFHLAEKVGKTGKVFANEIESHGLADVKAKIARENIKNIVPVLGTVDDPLFPEKNLDIVVMLLVVHHLDKPIDFMRNVEKYLKKGGILVIIERDTDKDRTEAYHFMSTKQIMEVFNSTNFVLVKKDGFLPKDTMYFFKLKE